jgi:protein involved in polysaccharide export with SLBB domain
MTGIKKILIYIIYIHISFNLLAQTVSTDKQTVIQSTSGSFFSEEAKQNVQIAISSPYYPVTPGDVYTVSFFAGSVPVTYTIVLDKSYKIKVANLGIIDASGKSYIELKNQVESLVSKNYPMSGVQFVLTQTSQFLITITGEVKTSIELKAWALSRLSQFWADNRTKYSSMRKVRIRSAGGSEKVYDLFKAQRYGDLNQDPFVRPGDTIILEKYDRQVTIEGEVRRPGTYQLLEGEGLKELIEQYGDGYTEVADRNRIELTRYVAGKSDSGEKIYITKDEIEKHYQLNNLDRIIIKNITDLKPVLFIEGAIKNENNATTALEGTNKATIQFETGMNYATLVRNVRGLFSYVSDTENSYIIRNGKKIPMNLNPMLFDASYKSEFFIEPYDSLIIPFKQFFITVSGAVRNPGRYPYIPDRDWQYYIALAGGFDEQKNSGEEITIYDINGRKLKKTDGLSPECKIVAHSNSFLYYYNQYSPVVMTTLSLITTLLSIYAITSR